ncbi:MAG: outer membrane protein assembly factor BamB [Gammaproteobacteria bacterium]
MRAALLVATCALLSACSLFGEKDEEAEPAALVAIDAPIKIDTLWNQGLGGDAKGLRLGLIPATNGARIFAASDNGNVYAFDATTGKEQWRTDTELKLSGGPGVGRDQIALGSSEGELIVLAIDNGEVLWQTQIGSEVLAAPAFSSNRLIARTGDGTLLAYGLDGGEPLWNVRKRVQGLTLRGNASPVISGDVVISGFDDGSLLAINLDDGTTKWERATSDRRGRTELERLADVDGRVVVVGEDVFTAGFQGTASLLSVVSGSPIWRQDMSSHQSVAVDWNRMYLARDDNAIVALNRSTGVIAWDQPALKNRDITGPAVAGNYVVVGDFEGYLHFMQAASGEFVGRVKVAGASIVAQPLVVSDVIYVLATDGSLTALRPQTPEPAPAP